MSKDYLELEVKFNSLKEENSALIRKVEFYENLLRENGIPFDPQLEPKVKRVSIFDSSDSFQSQSELKIVKRVSIADSSSSDPSQPHLTPEQKRDKTNLRKVSGFFSKIPQINTISLATPYEAREKDKEKLINVNSTKELLIEPLITQTKENLQHDYEILVKLTILGEKELRKDILHSMSGQAIEGNIEKIIPVKIPNSQILLNVWSFELGLQNTHSHKLFLSGTGVQIIVCNLACRTDTWREEVKKWLVLSKFHSRYFLPTLIVGYSDGKKKKKWSENFLADQFKKCKVVEFVVIENPKLFEKNSKLINDAVHSLVTKSSSAKKKGPPFYKELVSSLSSIRDNRLVQFAELVTLIKMCARNLHREAIQENVDSIFTVTDETAHEIFLDSEISSAIEWLHDVGVIITFSDINFRDVVIVDPGIFMLLLQSIRSSDAISVSSESIVTGSNLNKIYFSYISATKIDMISKMLLYFEVIYPYRGSLEIIKSDERNKSEKYWIVPSLVSEPENFTEMMKDFRAFYLQQDTKCNRFLQFDSTPFSIFSRLYVILLNSFCSRLQITAWQSSKIAGIFLSSETEKVSIQLSYDLKELQIYFANSNDNQSLFCQIISLVSHFLAVSYPTIEKQELVQCTSCDIDTTPISELFEMIHRDRVETISCPMTSQSIALKSLCPDFFIPEMEHICNFTCDEKIGEGAFGFVHKGKLLTGEIVAIKTLREMQSQEEKLTVVEKIFKFRELLHEITILTKLDTPNSIISHPNIIKYYGPSLYPSLSLVMEFAPHGILGDFLYHKSGREFNEVTKTVIAMDIAKGVQYLHGLNPPIIHRDLRSYNIFMFNLDYTNEETVIAKIGDFGLANSCAMSMCEILPTWQWLAPEIFSGERYDETSDVYSFGMVLYEIFARILPYTDQTQFIIKHRIKLTDEQLENQELIGRYEAQGYDINTEAKEANFEEFKIQNMKSAILDGLRPTVPDSVNSNIRELIKLCWRKRIPKRPLWSNILSVLQCYFNSIKSKLFTDVRSFPIARMITQKRLPVRIASFEAQLQQEKMKLNQENNNARRTPRGDRDILPDGLTMPVKNTKKLGLNEIQENKSKYSTEEFEVLLMLHESEGKNSTTLNFSQKVRTNDRRRKEKKTKKGDDGGSSPIEYVKQDTAPKIKVSQVSEKLNEKVRTKQKSSDGEEKSKANEKGHDKIAQIENETKLEPKAEEKKLEGEIIISTPIETETETVTKAKTKKGENALTGESRKDTVTDMKGEEKEIEEKFESVLTEEKERDLKGKQEKVEEKSQDKIEEKSQDEEEPDEENDEEYCRNKNAPLLRSAIIQKLAKLDKTFSGIVHLVKYADFDFLQHLLKFTSVLNRLISYFHTLLPERERSKISGTNSDDKLTRIRAVLAVNFVDYVHCLRSLTENVDSEFKFGFDTLLDISKVVRLIHIKTSDFLAERKSS